jgi:hypothetical protein
LDHFGADAVDVDDTHGNSALMLAGCRRDGERLANHEVLSANWRRLHERGASLQSALLCAQISGEFAQFAIAHGADVNARNAASDSPLLVHARVGAIWTLQHLVTHGAVLTASDAARLVTIVSVPPRGASVLHVVAGEPDVVDAAVAIINAVAKYKRDRKLRCSVRLVSDWKVSQSASRGLACWIASSSWCCTSLLLPATLRSSTPSRASCSISPMPTLHFAHCA